MRVPLYEVMEFYGLQREISSAGFFETASWRRLYQEVKASIVAGHLVALTGTAGSGKTLCGRWIRGELERDGEILISTSLALEKNRVRLSTLMDALFVDLGVEKRFPIPSRPELRQPALLDLIRSGEKPVVLVVDDAEDLPGKTFSGLWRLMEAVREAGATMGALLIGLPSLATSLQVALEESRARLTVLELPGTRGQEREFLEWMLAECAAPGVQPQSIFTTEALDILAERLGTPLWVIHHTWRALQAGYAIGQKPVERDTVEKALAPELGELVPLQQFVGPAQVARPTSRQPLGDERSIHRCASLLGGTPTTAQPGLK